MARERAYDDESRSGAWFYVLVAIMVAGIIGFRIYWENTFGGVVVDGKSMNQTLENGDKLLMRYLKDADDLQRGDVIVVRVSEYEEFAGTGTEYLIKRLIAIEGDKVRCNGEQVEICYAGTDEYVILDEPYAYYGDDSKVYSFEEYVVGEDEIFFLGDNRENSYDSRYKDGNSHLTHLYKESDVYGTVSEWAIENRSWLSKIFFWSEE